MVFSGIAAGLTVGAAADTVPVTRNAILRGNAVHCMARAPNLPANLESPQLAASLSGAGSSLGRLPLHTVFLGRVKHVLSRSNWKCSLEALTGALLPALGTRLALYKHYEENLCDPYSC